MPGAAVAAVLTAAAAPTPAVFVTSWQVLQTPLACSNIAASVASLCVRTQRPAWVAMPAGDSLVGRCSSELTVSGYASGVVAD